jgi:hypothetical protein
MAIEQCQEFAADYPNFLVDSRVQRGVQRHDRLFGPEILGLTGVGKSLCPFPIGPIEPFGEPN